MSSLAMAIHGTSAWAGWHGNGASDEARALEKHVATALDHLFQPISSGGLLRDAESALSEIQEEASISDWDGRGAAPLNAASLREARRFLALLPTGFPTPQIGADPDGEIALEWFGRRGWVISISLSPTREITYAGLFGVSRVRGREFFGDEIPETIVEGIRRAIGDRASAS